MISTPGAAIIRRINMVRENEGISKNRLLGLLTGVRGASQGNLHRLLAGQAEPGAQVVAAIAKALGVLPGWVLTGEGPRTSEEQRWERAGRERELDSLALFYHPADVEVVSRFNLGAGDTGSRRRKAILRLARRLRDGTEVRRDPLSDDETRADLLQAAAEFLVAVEREFATVARGFLQRRAGQRRDRLTALAYVEWSDAILAAFVGRVTGIGSLTRAEIERRWG